VEGKVGSGRRIESGRRGWGWVRERGGVWEGIRGEGRGCRKGKGGGSKEQRGLKRGIGE